MPIRPQRLGRALLRGPAAARGRLRAVHPIWWLNAAIVIVAAGAVAGPIDDYPAFATITLPWWLLAAATAVTERWPVHLEFRRSAHSFSLTDVPLALALMFADGAHAVAAIACGGAVALAMRRMSPIKFVFNLGQFLLATCLGLVIVHSMAGLDPSFGPWLWAGVFLATHAGGLLTITLLTAVMYLAEGTLERDQARSMFAMDAVVTAMNTSFAIVLGVVLVEKPSALPILLLPILIAFLGYRKYVTERQRHEKLRFLYEANQTLSRSPEVAQALEGLLARALDAFRAQQAEVVLFPSDGGESLRTSLGSGDGERMVEIDEADGEALRAFASGGGGPMILEPPFPAGLRPYLEARGVRQAMLAVMEGEQRQVGVLLLANCFGLGRRFTTDDLTLFETLASNASAALQYDRLEQAVGELRELQGRLQHQAHHDSLTGLSNRALFGQEVRAALADDASSVAVLFIDLDDFKTVNDSLGHVVGDELLRGVALKLARCVRTGDLVARLGGDEFAVLVRGHADPERAAVEVGERILEAFSQPVTAGLHVLSARLSIGVATGEHSGAVAEDLLRDADVAMYEAKGAGKGRIAVFDPAMREAILRRHGVKEELERAIETGELRVQYQPIVDLATGTTVAMEALVRWQHPERGRIPPGEFIPVAEETGLIVPLGRHVVVEACRRARAWNAVRADEPPVAVQVNLSARELEDDGLVEAVGAALEDSGLEPDQLVLEITETLLVQDAARGAATLERLRGLGVGLALDDFGTGYSSLSYLRGLPLDALKIAKPFIDRIAHDEEDAAFVRLIVELAKVVGLPVVAEGVETAEQLVVLRKIGCDRGQGFYFAPPLDLDGPAAAGHVGSRPA